MARGTGRWLCVLDDGCARLETWMDFCLMANHHRGDASCSTLQPTIKPLRNQSEQRLGREILQFVPGRIAQMGNHLDSGLKRILHRFRLPFQHGSGRKDVGGCFLRLASPGISQKGTLGLRRLLRLASLGISPRGRLGSMVLRMLLCASGCISHGGGIAT